MGLQNVTISKTAQRRDTMPRIANAAEDFFPHAHVAILDDDLLDEYFEPDGVNDFVRDFESWNPDRES